MIPILSSVQNLAQNYDAWFCDVWGVVHNGREAFEGAVEACCRYRESGGRVVLLTNAPRPWDSVADQLTKFGVPEKAYCSIVSSGDVTNHLIKARENQAIYHIGPQRDYPILELANITPASFEEAELILLTGLVDDDVETPETYKNLLLEAKARGIEVVCANPDLMVERGTKLVYCAGAVAALYEEMGGVVHYAGKPFLPVYKLAMEILASLGDGDISQSRVLCIGDGIKTDMAGAFAAGFDALYVASALHVGGEGLSPHLLEELFPSNKGQPVGAVAALSW